MNARVWVTGVNGFSGRYFVDHVRSLTESVEIVGFDIAASTNIDVNHYEVINLVDADSIVRLAEKYPPTHVLHCAAAVFEPNVDLLWKINVRGTAILISSLRAVGLKNVRIVCIGSAAEYAPNSDAPISETNEVSPVSEYGKSKLAQSLLALSLGSVMEQSVIVARTFNLIGPGISENLVPGALLKRLSECTADEITVSDAFSSRDFVDVRDAVAAYWQLLLRGDTNSIYNVCSGQSITIADLAHRFVDSIAKKIRIKFDGSAEPSNVLGSNQKLRRDVGWAPAFSVDASVADMILAASQ